MSISRLSHSIVLAWGWRRALIAFAAGAATVLALAPFDLWPVAFLTFPVLVWLIDGASAGRLGGLFAAALTGWWFGFGYFLAGLYWIGHAFLVDARTFAWLLPFAVVAMPAGLAVFTAIGALLARLFWSRGWGRILALALGFTVAEWLRGHLFTGFPWNAFGYALTGPLMLAQAASLVGLWGLTFLAVALFSSPAAIGDEGTRRRRYAPLAVSVVLVAALAGYGAWRLAQAPTQFVENVRLRIMQPNLQQDEKFNPSARQQVMNRYVSLSDRATGPQTSGMRDVTHLIWPESAFPFFLSRQPDALAQIADLLPANAVLITGGVRPAESRPGQRQDGAYNSVYIVNHDGGILSVYDKVHLVPFGEYLPLQALLERLGFMQLTKVRGGFLAGDRRRSFAVPHAPRMVPLICYEIVFPGAVIPPGERPGWLLNVTNDGWFGISTGPYQHFQQARLRAIEQGLPLVRAANTGISAIVDPLGRVMRSLSLGTEGVLDGALPRPIAPTFYARTGDAPVALLCAVVLVALLRRRSRRGG